MKASRQLSSVKSPAGGFQAIVIGSSAGGMKALGTLLRALPVSFPLPILIVQHRLATNGTFLSQCLDSNSSITVKEAEEKEAIKAGCIYMAPPNYHLLVERDCTLSLSNDKKVLYSRPSIDVLFESAAYVWSKTLIGIILTGANEDGARGLELIRQRGGTTIVQNPATAEYDAMPTAARPFADHVLNLEEIGSALAQLT